MEIANNAKPTFRLVTLETTDIGTPRTRTGGRVRIVGTGTQPFEQRYRKIGTEIFAIDTKSFWRVLQDPVGTLVAEMISEGSAAEGFGTWYQYAESLAAQSVAGTAFTTKGTITTPVDLPAGRYRVGWSFLWAYNSSAANYEGRILLDGATTVWSMVAEPQNAALTQRIAASGSRQLTLTAGVHTLQFQFRSQTVAANTALASDVALEFWRVGP